MITRSAASARRPHDPPGDRAMTEMRGIAENDRAPDAIVRAPRVVADATDTVRNRLLRGLPAAELRRVLAACERVEIRPRQILHHWNLPMQDVYFVEQGLISVSVKVSRERSVEGWLIGSDGMTGIPVLLGDAENPPHRRVVQVGGSALRMSASDFSAAVQELEFFRRTLHRYVQFVLSECSQWGACNAHHSLKQRTARWLLGACDGLQAERLPITHQLLARLLGVRRASVSKCLAALEAVGAIRNTRSLVEIADPAALEAIACDCHRIVRREYRQLLER
jgi:CRP-like cAMP-binding protein